MIIAAMAFIAQHLRIQTFLHKVEKESEMQQLTDILNFIPDGVVIQKCSAERPGFNNRGLDCLMDNIKDEEDGGIMDKFEKRVFMRYSQEEGVVFDRSLCDEEHLSLRQIIANQNLEKSFYEAELKGEHMEGDSVIIL